MTNRLTKPQILTDERLKELWDEQPLGITNHQFAVVVAQTAVRETLKMVGEWLDSESNLVKRYQYPCHPPVSAYQIYTTEVEALKRGGWPTCGLCGGEQMIKIGGDDGEVEVIDCPNCKALNQLAGGK